MKKFFEIEAELDNEESPYVRSTILTYEKIKSKVTLREKISIYQFN